MDPVVRYYFQNEKLIRVMEAKRVLEETTSEHEKRAASALATAKGLKVMFEMLHRPGQPAADTCRTRPMGPRGWLG